MKLLTVAEVAEFLSVSPSLVYRLKDDGEIPCYRIGRGAIRFSQEDVERYLAARHVGKERKQVQSTAAGSPVFRHLDPVRLAAAWREKGVS
jgi:excisionase family DNA binding protein